MHFKTPVLSLALFVSVSAFGLWTPEYASAQSTIELDIIDLAEDNQADLMRKCLLGEEGFGDGAFIPAAQDSDCANTEFGDSVDFTLDDVVNLGIVDHGSVAQPAQTAAVTAPETKALPSIDLEILFAYNSAELSAGAYQKLHDLSSVLTDPQLDGFKLLFVGHTDATGGAAFNRDLSQRRAESVAAYVLAVMSINPNRVAAAGIGFDRLKNTVDPSASENRRVQLVLVPLS